MKKKKSAAEKRVTTTKRLVWVFGINGVIWVWCSYVLAYLGREEIAESLSQAAVTEIIAVILTYCTKSLFEKRDEFGGIGREKYDEDSEDM